MLGNGDPQVAEGFHLTDTQTQVVPRLVSNDEGLLPQCTAGHECPMRDIDHIFTGGSGLETLDFVTDLWRYGQEGGFSSDHRAILATLGY